MIAALGLGALLPEAFGSRKDTLRTCTIPSPAWNLGERKKFILEIDTKFDFIFELAYTQLSLQTIK